MLAPGERPLVSVVIPTYDRGAYLREAVQSVLDQSYQAWELIVVDDGSSDGSVGFLEALADSRIQVVRQPHSGNPARMRNLGITRAGGEYVAFLDSDDVWMPEKLSLQVADLRLHPDCRWSYTDFKWVNEGGEEIPVRGRAGSHLCRGWIFEDLIAGHAWTATPSVLAERGLLVEAGGFDESLLYSEDYDLWLKLSRLSPVTVVTDRLVGVRQHRGRQREAQVFRYGVEVYRRLLADRQPSDARGLCRRAWVRASVHFADRLRFEGQHDEAFSTLRTVLPYGLGLPRWWVSLLKTGLRPLMPGFLLRGYRSLREMLARREPT